MLLPFQLARKRFLQAIRSCRCSEYLQILAALRLLRRQRLQLLLCSRNRALQFVHARLQRAPGECCFLGLAFQRAQLFPVSIEFALGMQHRLFVARVLLLRLCQRQIQFFKCRPGGHAALLQILQYGVYFIQVQADLVVARAGLLGLLRQTQKFYLQAVMASLAGVNLATVCVQTLTGFGVGAFGARQPVAAFFMDQLLRTQGFSKILDFLGASQQTSLLAVLGVKINAVTGDCMAALHVNGFARLQLAALFQRLFQRSCGVAAMQPAGKQGSGSSIVQTQQIHHVRQRLGCIRHGRDGRYIKTQFGRRRIAGKGTHRFEPPDFPCGHALAQGCLQGILPALLDMQPRPQFLHVRQAVFLQPGRQFSIGSHFFLQGLKGVQPRSQIGLLVRFIVERLLRLAALFVELRNMVLQLVHPRLQYFKLFAAAGQLRLHVRQLRRFGNGQRVAIRLQTLTALVLLAHLFVDAALFGRQHLDLLLHLGHAAALAVGLLLGLAQGVFQRRQLLQLLLKLRGQHRFPFFLLLALCHQGFTFLLCLLLAFVPLALLLIQLPQTLFDTLAVFHHETDFGLELADLGRHLIQQALGQIDLIACSVMRLTNGFKLGLDMAHVGHAIFEIRARLFHRGANLVLI